MIWLAFIFGLIIGSFLNALIWRIYVRRSVVKGRSICPECKHVLVAKDLVPLLSFVWQQGRCRYCHERISWQYPLVELSMAVAFAALVATFGLSWVGAWYAVVACLLLLIFVLDFRYSIIPDSVSLPLLVLGALSIWTTGLPWTDMLIGVGVGGGFFLLQWLVSRGKWIGDGDIRLGAAMGAMLGWKLLLVALFLAYVAGAMIGLILLVRGKKTMESKIPFGTFLAAATLVCLFWGNWLVGWYLGLFGL